jgi:hypothetical protein
MTLDLVPLDARRRSNDISGFGVFSGGDAGQAHVMAHRMLDQGRHEIGHRWLGNWLATHEGKGSDWTHLQWHMAIFELALDQWDAAFARFDEHILPVAASTDDALTDAPAMLWQLRLCAGGPVVLPWEPVRKTAARKLPRASDPYLALHCILALAGAGDVRTLDRWINTRPQGTSSDEDKLLTQLAIGLRAFAATDYRLAAGVLHSSVPRVSQLGGSRAQNELFRAISDLSWRMANETIDEAA